MPPGYRLQITLPAADPGLRAGVLAGERRRQDFQSSQRFAEVRCTRGACIGAFCISIHRMDYVLPFWLAWPRLTHLAPSQVEQAPCFLRSHNYGEDEYDERGARGPPKLGCDH